MTIALPTGCGSSGAASVLTCKAVTTSACESHASADNGMNRVRRQSATPADGDVLAETDVADLTDPAGYRNPVAIAEQTYAGKLGIDVAAGLKPPAAPKPSNGSCA